MNFAELVKRKTGLKINGSTYREQLKADVFTYYKSMCGNTPELIRDGWICEVVGKKYSKNLYLYCHLPEVNLLMKTLLPYDFINELGKVYYVEAMFLTHNKNIRFKDKSKRVIDNQDVNITKAEDTIESLLNKIQELQAKEPVRKRKVNPKNVVQILEFIRQSA